MITESTLEKAIAIADRQGIAITELNATEFFKKALMQEVELAAEIATDVRHQFGRGYALMNSMCNKVHSGLNASN